MKWKLKDVKPKQIQDRASRQETPVLLVLKASRDKGRTKQRKLVPKATEVRKKLE